MRRGGCTGLFQTPVPGQTVAIGGLSIFVGDVRMARTEDRLRVMEPAQYDALRTWVHGLAGPGILVLGQPIFATEAGLKGYVADWSLPDFRQYRDLVGLLVSTPHDIIVLTGDVHFGRAASCQLPSGRRLIELIASPISLVSALVGGHWKPTPDLFPAIPVPGVPQTRITGSAYEQTANHAMTVGFSAVGPAVRLTATAWPIRAGQPAVGTPVFTTDVH